MKLEIFTIGNTEKDFLRKRNSVIQSSSADLIMILNSDIEVKNFEAAIQHFEDDPKVFAVTFSPASSKRGAITEVSVANGGSSIYRRTIWNEIGGIDLLFEPYWWDDVDYSFRAIQRGYRIVEDGRINVTQIGDMGTDILQRNLKSVLTERRNYLLFLKKNKPEEYKVVRKYPLLLPFVPWVEWRYFSYHYKRKKNN